MPAKSLPGEINKADLIRGKAENKENTQKFKEGALSRGVETCEWPKHPAVMSVPLSWSKVTRRGIGSAVRWLSSTFSLL